MTRARNGRPDPGLRVVHVTRQFHPNRGGLEDFVANLGREQVRVGHDVEVVTCDRLFTDPGRTLPPEGELDGMSITRIPFRGSSRYPLAPGVLRRIGHADIVHVHAVDFFYDYLAWTRPLHGRPLVATTHGGFFHTNATSVLKRLWFQGPTRLSSRLYDAVVACSTSDARLFSRIAPDRVRVIENGVGLAKFAGAASPVPRKAMVTLGRFSDNKRLDRVLDAAAALVGRDPEWRLDIVGSNSDWTRERVLAEAARRGLADRVEVTTGLDDRGVAARLREASVFVSASEYEGFGIALIEAMSAGLVPVVHPNESFGELARRHDAIRLSDFSDADATATAVEAALATASSPRPDRGAELSRYSWAAVAASYADVYDRALARSRETAPLGGRAALIEP